MVTLGANGSSLGWKPSSCGGEVRCSYHLIDKMQKNMNIKYMHKKLFQVKCGNIIKYRSNARNKNIYKCRMQRNMNINIDQMNIDGILEKTTYQYHWKIQEPWPNHVEREWMSWEVRVKREKWDWESSWVDGIDVCGWQFVLYRGHRHHCQF